MDFLTAIILGVIEGLTEFLPISSTGHLILAAQLLNTPQTEFVKSFEIAIQLGAILSIAVLYWRSLLLNFRIIKRLFVSFVPTGIVGLLLYRVFKQLLLGNQTIVLITMFAGGVFIVFFERFYPEKQNIENMEDISYKQCVMIGIFQSLAIIPGVSRAAPTILGGLALGLKRRTIVEYSFLLAVPTFVIATGYDLIQSAGGFSFAQFNILVVGFVSAFVVAILAVKSLLSYVKNHDFTAFGIYRIIIALAFVLLLYMA